MTGRTRRGQPLVALIGVLAGWVVFRAAVWDWPVVARTLESPAAVVAAAGKAPMPLSDHNAAQAPGTNALASWPQPLSAAEQSVSLLSNGTPLQAAQPRPLPLLPEGAPAPSMPSSGHRIAAGHQLLFMAAVAQLPLPPEALARFDARPPLAPRSAAPQRRWSADAWLLLRPGGNGFNLPGAGLPGANLPSGAYGASQVGAVIRYRLAPSSPLRPAIYLRASSGLKRPRGEEAALGLSLRPLSKVPVAAMGEVRVTRTLTGEIVRPAVALVSEFPPVPLPLDARAEVYGQAGWVGGKSATLFADGQARVDRPLVRKGRFELRAGIGAWGGAQEGAERLDLGPTATLSVPLGPGFGRIAADYRFRIAGDAAPLSGPAVTVSAGF